LAALRLPWAVPVLVSVASVLASAEPVLVSVASVLASKGPD
jgi:hypothetical protein